MLPSSSRVEFGQKLRRYKALSQKCEVKRTELNIAYKRALKDSDDSYHKLSTLAGLTSQKTSTTPTLSRNSQRLYSYSVSPYRSPISISRHSPTRYNNFNTNTNTNTNTNINFNSLLSNSPIAQKNFKKEETSISDNKNEKFDNHFNAFEKKKDDDFADSIEDSQEIFDIIHSKNESNSKTKAEIDEEFQRLVQQADNEEKEQKKVTIDPSQKSNVDINLEEEDNQGSDANLEMNNFEIHSDGNEEDTNDENEINFEQIKGDGNQFEVDEEEENKTEEENENPFEKDNVNEEDIEIENQDQIFEEEEEEIDIHFPDQLNCDKDIIKAIANKVTSSNADEQVNNQENENLRIESDDEVDDQLPEYTQNNSTVSNSDN